MDLILGIITTMETKDRFLDRIAKTTVITEPNPGWSSRDEKTLNLFKWIFTLIAGLFMVIYIIKTGLDWINFLSPNLV